MAVEVSLDDWNPSSDLISTEYLLLSFSNYLLKIVQNGIWRSLIPLCTVILIGLIFFCTTLGGSWLHNPCHIQRHHFIALLPVFWFSYSFCHHFRNVLRDLMVVRLIYMSYLGVQSIMLLILIPLWLLLFVQEASLTKVGRSLGLWV